MRIFNLTKKDRDKKVTLPPLVLSVWSPMGRNTAAFSFELASALSEYTGVFLAETACLGIPRLAFAAKIMDREKSMDALILKYEKTGEIEFGLTHRMGDTLAVLPASAYSSPDYPIPSRVDMETLLKLPAGLINNARQHNYPLVVFECQGQLSNPMTFFVIRHSDYVFLPVEGQAEIAVTLTNLKKLIQAFKYPPEMFKVIAAEYTEEIQDITHFASDKGSPLQIITVLPPNIETIAEQLAVWKKAEAQKMNKAGAASGEDDEIRIRL